MLPPEPHPSDPDYVISTISRVNWEDVSPPAALFPWTYRSSKRRFQELPRKASLLAGREMTVAELEAAMSLTHDMMSTSNMAKDVFTAVPAFVFWRRGMATYSFPFWSGPKFNPETFRFPLLPFNFTGARARIVYHGLRLAAYWVASSFFAGGPAGAAATAVMAGRAYNEPSLEQWRADCIANSSPGKMYPTGDPLGLPRPQDFPRQQHTTRDQPQPYFGGGDGSSSAPWRTDEDSSRASSQAWPQAPSAPPPAEQAQSRRGDYDDPFDDASPAAPSHGGSRPDAGGASAWDRLRRESTARADQSRQPSSWDSRRAAAANGSEESWSYSTPEESQAKRDREKAQKEFDEMLERERRNETDSGYRRRS